MPQLTEEELDRNPLTFGSWKGKTPEEVAQVKPDYIRWLYETVKNRDTCSYALYRSCRGKGQKVTPVPEAERRAPYIEQSEKKKYWYEDDPDDDIPF